MTDGQSEWLSGYEEEQHGQRPCLIVPMIETRIPAGNVAEIAPPVDWSPVVPSQAVATLIQAGLAYPGAHVSESEQHPLLMDLAQQHAVDQARRHRQSHNGFPQRAVKIRAAIPGVLCAEIVNESWDREIRDPVESVAREMFHGWEQSKGHWSVASEKHRYAGYGMAKSNREIWYSCILVCD